MRQKSNNTKHFGVIDIGSVAIRAEVLTIEPPNSTKFLVSFAERQMPKLGDYGPNSTIKDHSLNLAVEHLQNFSQALSKWNCEKTLAVGTAVFRQASNQKSALELLEEKLGQKIKIISEIEEATLIAEGIMQFEPNLPEEYLLLDIGGRSSEISFVKNKKILGSISLPLGAISIYSNFFETGRPTKEEELKARTFLKSSIASHTKNFPFKAEVLVGSSGTLRMLKRMLSQTKIPNPDLISCEMIDRLYQALLSEDLAAKKLLEQEKNRAELVYSGLLILDEIVTHLEAKYLSVSNYSLRHGLLKRMIFEALNPGSS